MLGGLLLLIPLLLPATALAAPRSAAATPPLTQPQQIVNLAGVSVVRLSLSYVPAKGTAPIVCTALGTIIASWPATGTTDKNTWVLTDGSLLNTSKKNSCAPDGTLASVQILVSNEFTGTHPNLAALDTLTCTPTGSCSDTAGSQAILTLPTSSAILFSFHTPSPMPYVGVERANTSGEPAPTSIELSASATTNSIPPSATKNVNASTLAQFLTPIANATAPGNAPTTPPGAISAQIIEPGMPFIDGYGNITGDQLLNTTSLVTVSDIESLEGKIQPPPGTTLTQQLANNILSQEWDSGIIQYELGEDSQAIQTFSLIQDAPPTFKAPATFSALARAKVSSKSGTSGSTTPSSHGEANSGSLSFWFIVIGLIAGTMALVLLFLLMSIRFGRRRAERKRELEQFEADAEIARQRRFGKEKPVAVPQQYPPSPSLYRGAANYPPAQNVSPAANISPAPGRLIIATSSPPNNVQPQQPAPLPKMQDDPAIQAVLQRLWDRAGR